MIYIEISYERCASEILLSCFVLRLVAMIGCAFVLVLAGRRCDAIIGVNLNVSVTECLFNEVPPAKSLLI